jgi:hypothetical protein
VSEDAARLAGSNHVGEQGIEGLRVAAHGIGQRGAGFDVRSGLQDHRGKVLVFSWSEDSRHCTAAAGVDHHGELAVNTARFLAATFFPVSPLLVGLGLDLAGVIAS